MTTSLSKAPSRSFLTMLLVFTSLLAATVAAAQPAIEIDGDGTSNTATPPNEDWDVVVGWVGGIAVLPSSSAEIISGDPTQPGGGLLVDPSGETLFTQGTKDIEDINMWRWTDQNAPDKDEISSAMAALYPNQILYFAADRVANNGDATLGFWLLQNDVGLVPDGTFSGLHAINDILIVSDFENGGGLAVVPRVFRWDPTDPEADNNLVEIFPTMAEASAIVNDGPVTPPWPYEPKFDRDCPPGETCWPENSFFEGMIDLGALGVSNCFSSFIIETRSSTEPTAELKDFILGDFTTVPQCTITGVDMVCDQSTTTFSSEVTLGGVTYEWTVTGDGVIVGPDDGPTVDVMATGEGSFDLTLDVDRSGCGGQCTKTVVVDPLPTCDISGPATVCADSDSHVYEATVNPTDGVAYEWTVTGDATIVGPDDGASVTVDAGSMDYTVKLALERNGCLGSCEYPVTVNPNPTCTIMGPEAVCEQSTGNTYSVDVDPDGGTVTYKWTVTGNGSIVGDDDGSEVTVTAGAAGSYTVKADVVRDGCPGSCQKTVVVNQNLSCSITGDDPVCAGATGLTYTANVTPSDGVTYKWTIAGNGTIVGDDDEQSVSVTAGDPGSFTLTLDVERNGCVGQCERTVTVDTNPVCEITSNGPPLCGNDGMLQAQAGFASYLWEVVDAPDGWAIVAGQGTNMVTYSTSPVPPGAPVTVRLTVEGDSGCVGTCEIDLTCTPPAPDCPRTVGFWGQQCMQDDDGSTKFDLVQMYEIAARAQARSAFFFEFGDADFPVDGNGGSMGAFGAFCEMINIDDTNMDQRLQAKRQFSGLLFNVSVALISNPEANNGEPVSLNESTSYSCSGFGQANTIGELIDAIDAELAELEVLYQSEGLSNRVKNRYTKIITCADAINNGVGLGDCTSVAYDIPGGPSIDAGKAPETSTSLPLMRPSPNPFTATTRIAYAVNGAGAPVRVDVFNVAGRRVRQLVNTFQTVGRYEVVWNGRDDADRDVTRGIYYLRVVVGASKESTTRVMYIK